MLDIITLAVAEKYTKDTAIALGAVSGWIASFIMNTKGGLIRNIILGVIGGVVGGWVFSLLNLSINGYLGIIITSVVGACLVVFIVNKIFK